MRCVPDTARPRAQVHHWAQNLAAPLAERVAEEVQTYGREPQLLTVGVPDGRAALRVVWVVAWMFALCRSLQNCMDVSTYQLSTGPQAAYEKAERH